MIGKDRDREREQEMDEVKIIDARHSRDLDAEVLPEAPPPLEPTAVPETEPEDLDEKQYPPELAKEAPLPEEPEVASAPDAQPAGRRKRRIVAPGQAEEQMPSEEEIAAFEAAQLRQVFAAGLTNYLLSHLNFLLNFAVIYLGRMPNPATGLISPDLEKAKTAIDLLDFIYSHVQKELPAQERTGVEQILADLKLSFMQAVTSAAPPPPKPAEGN